MAAGDREKWNSKYTAAAGSKPATPPSWLLRHLAIVPRGSALDVATGRGAAAIELARNGWQVTALDISDVGLRLAQDAARRLRAPVQWIVADLTQYPIPASRFDVITVFYFLDRDHLPQQIVQALRPGGMLVHETYTIDQQQIPGNKITNPEHMLLPGELLTMYRPLRVRAYREIALVDRAIAGVIAEKRE